MKSGKDVKLKSLNENFKIKIGAVENYKAPRSIYVNMTSWITVTESVNNLDFLKKNYRNQIKNYLRNNPMVSDHFELDTIIQLDISPTGIKMGKPTFFTLEINLYQNQKNLLPLVRPKNSNIKDLKPILENIANDILNLDFIVNNNHFKFQLKKNTDKELILA